MTAPTLAPWQRPKVASRPPANQPPPPPPDYGPPAPTAPPSQTPLRPVARSVPYAPAPTVPAGNVPRAAGRAWAPAGAAVSPAAPAPAPPGARASWVLPVPPPIMQPVRCHQFGGPAIVDNPANWVNYDPPPEAGGTGLQQTNADGSWVVHPLSVIHPGSRIGDEGPINEAFLSTPVVYLCAGRPYALGSPVVVPDGATLHLNRAAIDRDQIQLGEGASLID